VTKVNKSAEIIFNMTSQLVVGRSVTDLLKGVKAGYLLNSLKELTTKSYSVHLKANLTVTSG
jgi:hypothetical protein